jgi:hypothetical protein
MPGSRGAALGRHSNLGESQVRIGEWWRWYAEIQTASRHPESAEQADGCPGTFLVNNSKEAPQVRLAVAFRFTIFASTTTFMYATFFGNFRTRRYATFVQFEERRPS